MSFLRIIIYLVICFTGVLSTPLRSETPDSKTSSSSSQEPAPFEVMAAREYLEVNFLDPLPSGLIKWDKKNAELLYLSRQERPYIYLFGSVRPGYQLRFNNSSIDLSRGKFEIKFVVPLEPRPVPLTLVELSSGVAKNYRLLVHWKKIPPSLRFKVKEEGGQIVEKALGFTGGFKRSAFVQLYSEGLPVTKIDLDSQKHAGLTFRIQYSPEDSYDGWTLVVKDSQGQIVGLVKRYGVPPPYIEWREIRNRIFAVDTYSYQVILYKDDGAYEGPINRFETLEGLSVLDHKYLPKFSSSPGLALGFYNFTSDAGPRFSGMLAGSDLPFIFYNRLLVRGYALTTLHTLDQDSLFTYVRIGGGIRFYADGQSSLLGDPFMIRGDLYLNYCGSTFSQLVNIKRISQVCVLFEPHLVLWGYHYLIPSIEYGFKGSLNRRLSLGLAYNFFIRPWSVNLGLGFSYDRQSEFDGNPANRFKIFRVITNATFFL